MSFVSVQVIHESVQKIIIYATQNFDEELMEIHAWMSSFNTTSPHAATLDVNSSDTYQPPLVPEMFTRIHRMHELLENCAKGHRAPVFEMPTILICVATIGKTHIQFCNTIFVSSHMYQENLEEARVIVGSMNEYMNTGNVYIFGVLVLIRKYLQISQLYVNVWTMFSQMN